MTAADTRPDYTRQDCALTLREGLAVHLRENAGLFDPDSLAEPARTLFLRHDCVHVMFGLTTALEDEALADSWTFFAVDVPILRYARALKSPEVIGLIQSIPLSSFVLPTLRALPRIWRAFRQSRRMPRPWPWQVDDALLDTPIAELRRRYDIRVV